MKRTGICTKCKSGRVIQAAPVPDAVEYTGGGRAAITSRAGNLHVPRAILVTRNGEAVGVTEAYVCAGCGWFEEYVASPQHVAWDTIDGAWARVSG